MLATQRTKLSLWRWCQLMGINPLHFAQLSIPALTNSGTCDGGWFRWNYQDADRVSREEIAECIARAETEIESQLNYNLVPDWTVDERVQIARQFQPEFVNLGTLNIRGYSNALITKRKHFIAGGIRASTLLAAGSVITWSAVTQHGWKPIGTVSLAVPAGTSECEIRAYYPGHNGEDAYEIRPITVVVAGATATVTIKRETCVTEAIQDDFDPGIQDGTLDANFLTTVDVYRVWNDPQTHVSFLWEGDDCDDTLGQYATQTGVLLARDPELGIVGFRPATWDATLSSWNTSCQTNGRVPDIARLYYLSGLQDTRLSCPRTEMAADWARTVAIFASSMLEREVCGCASTAHITNWRVDMAAAGGAEELEIYNLSQEQVNNPFGSRRGAIYAWNRVNRPQATVGTGWVPS